MNLGEFLAELLDKRIKLWAEGDQLRYRAPKGAVTEAVRSTLTTYKAEILTFLRMNNLVINPTGAVLRPVSDVTDIPLSFAQERLWFIHQLQPDSPGYNMPLVTRIEGSLNVHVIEQVVNEIIRRHESLRTTFESTATGPVQVIHPPRWRELPIIDLEALKEGERAGEARRLLREEAARPFDLRLGPVVRTTLLRLSSDDHVMLYTIHHVAADGWSMGVLNKEIGRLYKAFSEGQASPLADLWIQYKDFAVWQRGWLRGQVLEGQLAYWKERLSGLSPLPLPTDYPRPTIQTVNGAFRDIKIGTETTTRLKELSQRQGVTLFMTLLAGWQVLLSRYSGKENVAIGSVIANRNRAEIEGLIGVFVNTLVLQTDLSGDPTIRELLQRVRETTLGAYAHQDLPFEKLVEQLQPERDLSRNPLVQVILELLNGPEETVQVEGIAARPMFGADVTTRFDLEVHLLEQKHAVAGWVIYNRDLFRGDTIRRMVEHLQRLLEAFVRDDGQRLSEVQMLSDSEREQLLTGWNSTGVDYPRGKCIHQLFEEQAEEYPGRVAVVFGNEQLLYRELNQKANQLAHHLRKLGVGPEVLVGICAQRSLEMIVGILGILKAGGAYVPLDVAYPLERLAYLLRDAQAKVILTQQSLAEKLPDCGASLVYLDAPSAAGMDQKCIWNLPSQTTPESLACVMYTSGSTGEPKGIHVIHRGVVRLVKETNYVSLGVDEIILQMAPVSFDASTFEIWAALLNGGQLVVMPPGPLAMHELELAVKQYGVTTLWLTANLFHQAVDTHLKTLVQVPQLLAGGDVLSPGHCRNYLSAANGHCLINGYGPTEATTFSCCYPMNDAQQVADSVSIGRPIANTQVYILDRHLTPVPARVEGEIYIGGDGLARGYRNRPELTAERFVPNPFSSAPGERLYRTGDLGRYEQNGNIEFLGRLDHQVKVRGYRVELGEIETVLGQHPGVRECIVVARDTEAGGKQLAAYVVRKEGDKADRSEWRHFLKSRLPEYMVPSLWVELKCLPLKPSGKLDRKELPVPETSRVAQDLGPRTPLEELMTQIWSEVLKIERIGVNENFFELGGHSLLATQVISRMARVFEVDLPLRTLFEAPTVAGLSEKVERARQSGWKVAAPPLQRVERKGEPLPLSFAQERLWFIDQLQPGGTAYNMAGQVQLGGPLDVDALERAINEIIRRHEVLRTVLRATPNGPVQVVYQHEWRTLPVVGLEDLIVAQQSVEAQRLIAEEAQTPFDLAMGPVVRTRLLRLAPDRHVILYTLHHVAADGWSIAILNREMGVLYEAFSKGEESQLLELPIQYADFAVWQRGWLQGPILEQQLNYWKKQLAGLSPLQLVTDQPRPVMQTFVGAQRWMIVGPEASGKLKKLSREQGVTLFMTLLTGFQVMLRQYSGQDDIAIGTPIANRNKVEIESLIGFFVNTLVLRTELGGDPTFQESLGRVKEVTLEAYGHQDLPFERLVEQLQPERDLSRNPLFQVLFALQNAPDAEVALKGMTVESIGGGGVTTRFDLELHFHEHSNGLAGRVVYNKRLFKAQTIERMLQSLERVLERMVCDPSRRLSEMDLLNPAERELLLGEWNNTHLEFKAEQGLHELFEEVASRTPEAIAVICGEKQLTYGQLNRHANHVAWRLRESGVGPEVLVGLCLERSLEMVIGLLAILKAGGAYVPMDPGYPVERLLFVLEDARVSVLLTQKNLAHRWPANRLTVLCVDEDHEAAEGSSAGNLTNGACSENLAYVIYTSGSTGRPKGVAIAHHSAVNLLHWARNVFGSHELRRVLASTSICFDLSVFEIFVPLCCGGSVLMLENILHLTDAASTSEVTLINTVPSAIAELLKAQAIPSSVRTINLAGELLSTQLVQRIYQQLASVQVYDLYGPSEATTYSTFASRNPGTRPTIGRPISNTQIYIVDSYGEPVPIGVQGELYIGGIGVARGYLNRAELTAERFVPDGFNREGGQRLYRTGDLARYREDGQIEFLGRMDQQVKVRGFRIELGEIEIMMRKHPAVAEAVAVPREDEATGKCIVGYVVWRNGACLSVDELRQYLRKELPDYMVPAGFVVLDQLPLTPNGKLDRKALPAPSLRPAAMPLALARTPLEEVVQGIFSQVLGKEQVGIHDNFFALGGHSLLGTQVISRVRREFEMDVPLHYLFEAPTVATLSGKVEEIWRMGLKLQVPPLLRTKRKGKLPASSAQERLWFIDRLQPNSMAQNMSGTSRLGDFLQVESLERAINEIVRRHEILRTTFELSPTGLLQVIHPYQPEELPVVDLSGLSQAQRDIEAERLLRDERNRPFDLTESPPIRVRLLRLEGKDQVLLYTIHHIASDGWSQAVLHRELSRLYEAFSRGQQSPLEELPIQYADFAVWQRDWLQNEVLKTQMAYWKKKLDGAPETIDFPADPDTQNAPPVWSAAQSLVISPAVTRSLMVLNRHEGITPFMVLLTGLAITLNRWTGQSDLVLGTVIAGRNRREIEELIGCFINFLPLRVQLSGDLSGRELLAQVRHTVLDAYAYQDCPFEKIVEAINPERSYQQNPLYNVALLLQNFSAGNVDITTLRATPISADAHLAALDLRFVAHESADEIILTCEYQAKLFEARTIENVLASFGQVLESLLAQLDTRISQFNLTDELQSQAMAAKKLIAVAATFTAQPLQDVLEFWMKELEMRARINFAPYNQVFQQLLDPQSLFSVNQHGLNVMLLRLEDWAGNEPGSTPVRAGTVRERITRSADEFVLAVKMAGRRNSTPQLIFICPASPAALVCGDQAILFKEMERKLVLELGGVSGVYLVTTEELQSAYPVPDYDDPQSDKLGRIPYSRPFFAAMATMLARRFHALKRQPYKAIALDCDQTLWAGICGEDGPYGVQVNTPHRALQDFMRAQCEAGMLLCLCSKNNDEDVAAVFEKRSDMPLQRGHFAAWAVNWSSKSSNLKALAAQLGLGLDSFIFVDDNPVECAEVKAHCPEVLVLQLPQTRELIPQFLTHCWAFDHLRLSAEDTQRIRFYQEQRQRQALQAETVSLAAFVAGLQLEIEVRKLPEDQVTRAAQLTERTNQFNFTTRRYSEGDIQKFRQSGKSQVLAVWVSDRFGDYGLVGLIIFEPGDEAIRVDTFLLSCRVLGKGVEHRMIRELGRLAESEGVASVDICFMPSAKNKPALKFLEAIAGQFRQSFNGLSVYKLPVELAVALAFDPANTAEVARTGDTSGSAEAPAPSRANGGFRGCRWIAIEANNVERILAAVESKTPRRSRGKTQYAPARTKIETLVCQIWAGLLRIDRIGIHDNFFELGGHSLLIPHLLAAVGKSLSLELPIRILFQSPTVAQLSESIEQLRRAGVRSVAWSSLAPIKTLGSKPPLFVVHDWTGKIGFLAMLASHLDEERPLYGLQAPAFEDLSVEAVTGGSLEELAAHYLETVSRVQSDGPYFLGGYSYGGYVAFEMARQLAEQGRPAAWLGIFDQLPLEKGELAMDDSDLAVRYVALRDRKPVDDRDFDFGSFQNLQGDERLKSTMNWLQARGRLSAAIDLPAFRMILNRVRQRWTQLATYVPRIYPGQITLFLTTTTRREAGLLLKPNNGSFGWNAFSTIPVQICEVTGDHHSMFSEPHVRDLATQLNASLNAVSS